MSTNAERPSYFCWFDTEFTSLELDEARLIQVAMVVTDTELVPITPAQALDVPADVLRSNGLSMTLRAPDGWEPNEFIRTHMASIIEPCRQSPYDVAQADEVLARYLDAVVGAPADSISERPVMAGNSVHSDWFLARRDLPAFVSRLHYRLLDASAFKSEWMAHYASSGTRALDKDNPAALVESFPQADLAEGQAHDAYYDAQASIAELAWYRARLATQG